MKHNRRLFRNFLSFLLVLVLCFTAALTAFAEEASPEAEAEQSSVLIEEGKAGEEEQAAPEVKAEPEELSEAEGQPEELSEVEEQPEEQPASEVKSDSKDQQEQEEQSASEEPLKETATTPTTPAAEATPSDDAKEEESSEEAASLSETDESGDLDAAVAETVEMIRSEFGDEAAESFQKLMNNPALKSFVAVLQQKLEAEFKGMSEEEIAEKLENMSDEEALALMEGIFSDPEIEALAEAVSEDEELAEELEKFLTILFGDLDDGDGEDVPQLDKPVSGTQGDNISWTLDTDGTLTISGTGGIIPSYVEFEGIRLPFYEWDDYVDNIEKVVIKDGVTDIAEDAFYWSSTLKTVVIPASVKSIGSAAFADCENLTAVYFQGDAPEIAEDAFEGCSENLTLYYREGTKGWDQLTGYRLAVWNAASSDGNSVENQTAAGTQSSSGAAADSTVKGTPHTGDTVSVWPFIILMAAAVICGASVVIRVRRKR